MAFQIVIAFLYASGWVAMTLFFSASALAKAAALPPTKSDACIWFGLSALWPALVWVIVVIAAVQKRK